MTTREDFENVLKQDRYDRVTRLVYADWLEEQGLDDEALEQRRCATEKWCEAAHWLEQFAKDCGSTCTNYKEVSRAHRETYEEARRQGIPYKDIDFSSVPKQIHKDISFDDVIQAGKDFIESNGEDCFVQTGSEYARNLMYQKDIRDKFWECWQTVTGTCVEEDEKGVVFSCTC